MWETGGKQEIVLGPNPIYIVYVEPVVLVQPLEGMTTLFFIIIIITDNVEFFFLRFYFV